MGLTSNGLMETNSLVHQINLMHGKAVEVFIYKEVRVGPCNISGF